MRWRKVGYKNPGSWETVLLYTDLGGGSRLDLGFYDDDNNTFRIASSNLPVKVSYWSYIELPPGENER